MGNVHRIWGRLTHVTIINMRAPCLHEMPLFVWTWSLLHFCHACYASSRRCCHRSSTVINTVGLRSMRTGVVIRSCSSCGFFGHPASVHHDQHTASVLFSAIFLRLHMKPILRYSPQWFRHCAIDGLSSGWATQCSHRYADIRSLFLLYDHECRTTG